MSISHTLREKRDFAGVIRLRILRWQDYTGLSRWADRFTMTLKRRTPEESEEAV